MDFFCTVYFTIFLAICFIVYKLLNNRKNVRPLWNLEDEEKLKYILSQIYSSSSLDKLENAFAEGVKCHSKYRNLFRVAMKERHLQITKNSPASSFEENEAKTRKLWLISFVAYYFLCWFAIVTSFFVNFSPKWLYFYRGTIQCVVLFAFTWCVYYCVYKKKGTRVLAWIVFISPWRMLCYVFTAIVDLWIWYVMILEIVLFSIYWLKSYQLSKINCEVKARQQLDGLKKNISISENISL